MSLPKDITHCLKQILSECYLPELQASKLKDGARVYRITGNSRYLYRDENGKVYYWDVTKSDGERRIDITRENLNAKAKQLSLAKWEFFLLERGSDIVAQELREALAEKGHAVNVRIGRGGLGEGSGSGSAYLTSIRIKQLSEPMRPGAVADGAVLDELGAISNELSEIHSKVNDLTLRLRSLIITMTLKAKL